MLTPYFLVALPQMEDETFGNSVVLVVKHNADGALGYILNNPIYQEDKSLAEMVAELKDQSGRTLMEYRENLFEGGPLDDEKIFVMHTVEELAEADTRLAEGLYLASKPDLFHILLEREELKDQRRFFLGYSAWEAGQLDGEIRAGSWLILPYDPALLFEAVEGLPNLWHLAFWKKILARSGLNPFSLIPQASADIGLN